MKASVRRALGASDGVVMKEDEFRLLCDLFAAKTGIRFGADARYAVERRLRERVSALGLSSYREYHHYLRFSPRADAEWQEANELLTTNETYFFREQYQLDAFRDEVLPLFARAASTRKRLSIWSAGCSTGEEVYTLAILIHLTGLFRDWDVRVYGTDISRRCVATARRALYGANSFRTTSPEMRRAFFTEQADGLSLVVPQIRQMCHFSQINLRDEDSARLLGPADVIFCRNVLIYFDAVARRGVIDMFHERLHPGGVLFLGHSESLINVSTAFELLHMKTDLAYRRPLTSSSPSR